MSDAQVTIIVATYNRPDALRACLNSVVQQTFKDWQLIVIGDNCDEQTGKVISTINDARIEYINLPHRFGEQSGPNSVGIALADTKYLAFLNHDDVWLKNHLQYGINILENGDYDFFIGGTAYSRFVEHASDELVIHVDEINTASRSPMDFFNHATTKYEPASSWIVETGKAREVGGWNYYSEIHRTPISDYLLRAWRANCKFYFAQEVTVWAVVTHYRNSIKKAYSYQSKEHELIELTLNSNTVAEMQKLFVEKLRVWNSMPGIAKNNILDTYNEIRPRQKKSSQMMHYIKWPLRKLIYNRMTPYLYKLTGIDIYCLLEVIKGHRKGREIHNVINIRTGDAPQTKPDIEKITQALKNRPFT